MGRPRNDPPSVFVDVRLYLRPGIDDDLIAFFKRYPVGTGRRPEMVKLALRGSGLEQIKAVEREELATIDDVWGKQVY